MEKHRMWVIGSVLAMVAIVALGWLLGIQPQLAAIEAAATDQASAAATNQAQRTRLASLKHDFYDIGTLEQQLAGLKRSVPTGAEIPAYVKQLDILSKQNGVTLKGFTVAEAQQYTPVTTPAGDAPADSGTETATAPATPPAPVAGNPPVTDARITPANFAALKMEITVIGSYKEALRFVNGVQSGPRLFLVTGLSTVPVEGQDDSAGNVEAKITGLIYSLVPPPAASESAEPAPTGADPAVTDAKAKAAG